MAREWPPKSFKCIERAKCYKISIILKYPTGLSRLKGEEEANQRTSYISAETCREIRHCRESRRRRHNFLKIWKGEKKKCWS